MDRRAKASRPARPTKGNEVLRKVDPHGPVSFAGTCYRVGNPYAGHTVGVRLVGDTVQITHDGTLLRTHRARHDKTKDYLLRPARRGAAGSWPCCSTPSRLDWIVPERVIRSLFDSIYGGSSA
jgi:hypothetical protein